MSDPTETPEPVEAAEPLSSDNERIDAALAMFVDPPAEPAEDITTSAPGPVDAATPEGEPAEEEGSPLDALTRALLAKKAEREPTPAPVSEQLMQQLLERSNTDPKIPEGYVRVEDIEAQLKADSVGFLRDRGVDLKAHTKAAYNSILKPETAAVEVHLNGKIQALEAKIDEALKAIEGRQQPQEIQAVVQAHAATQARATEDAFVAEIGGEDGESPFPLVARANSAEGLGRDYVLQRSRQIVDGLVQRGVDPNVISNEEILGALDKQLAIEQRAFGQAATGKTSTRQGATALTSELASAGTSRGALSDDERTSHALLLLQQEEGRRSA